MNPVEQALYTALQSEPGNWEVRFELLEKLKASGLNEEMAKVLSEASTAPGSETEIRRVVDLAGELKQPGLAQPLLSAFLQAVPSSGLGHYLLAKVYAKMNEVSAAREHYQQAVSLNSDLEDNVLAAKLADLGATQTHAPEPSAVAAPAPLAPPGAASAAPAAPAAAPVEQPPAAAAAPAPPPAPSGVAAPAPLAPPPGSGIERAADPVPAVPLAAAPVSEQVEELLEHGGWSEPEEGELTLTGRHLLVVEGGGEVHAQDAAKTTNQKLTAVVVALLAHVGLVGLFAMIAMGIPQPKPPQIIASAQAPLDQDDMMQQQEIEKQVQRKPVQSAQNQMEVVTVQGASAVSMPDIDTDLSSFDPIGIGDAFGASMTFDAGEDGGMVSFFGSKSMSKKVVFAVDYSASMNGAKDKLMRKELAKSVNALPGGINYQLIFFHGPAWVAGDEVHTLRSKKLDSKDPFIHYITVHDRKDYKWYSGYDENSRIKKGGKLSYVFHPASGSEEPEKLPPSEYISSTRSNIRKSLKLIEETPLGGGTDWRWPLYMAMNMEPDTIYFMTDGAFGAKKGLLEGLVDYNKKKSRAKINTICMMVPRASDHLAFLAEKTRGEFSLVLEDESVVRGKELEALLKKK